MASLLVRGACPHDCPDTCGVVTEVQDGKAIGFRGDENHPVTRGWLCAKVRPYLNHVYHPDRLMYPLRRVGQKGSGQWQRITWEEALEQIATRWKQIIAESGPAAILPYSYSGTLGLVQMVVASGRFWNRLGASQLHRSICGAAAETAVEATLGKRWSAQYEDVLNSKLVILWGTNPYSTGPHFMPFLRQAQRQGCKLIVIDPRRTGSVQGAHLHLQIRPGTDGVLALGMANYLVEHQMHDPAWMDAHTVGATTLLKRVKEFPLDRVAQVTGLDESNIREVAHLYGTIRPGLIKFADGINRNFNGGQNVRAILTLPALTAQYGTRGGGISYSTSGYVKWDAEAINKWSQCPPPARSVNMNRLGEALLGEITDPPIRSLFVFGANPATVTSAAGKIVKGMQREDLFTVVHELFLTDTADLADIVLPATSQLEQTDLHKAYGTTQLVYNAQAIEPLGEAKSNWELIGLLSKAMGFNEPWFHQTPDEVIEEVLTAMRRDIPHFEGISLETLKREGYQSLSLPNTPPFEGGRFPTPSGKMQIEDESLGTLGEFRTEIDEHIGNQWPANLALTMVTGASHHFVTSSFANQDGLLKGAGEPFVEIHPEDAEARGIQSGDMVTLHNSRGACKLKAVVTDATRPGVVISPKGRWSKLSGGSNVNWLTTDSLGDLAGQSSYHSTRVWIQR